MTNESGATWVADRDAATAATRVILKECLTPRRLLLQIGTLLLVIVVGTLTFLSGSSELGAAYLGAAVTFAVVMVTGAARLRASALRGAQIRYREGVVLEASFDEDRMTIRTPYSERTMAFTSLEALRVIDEWVVLKEWGIPSATVLPLALFPDSALERARAGIETSPVRSATMDGVVPPAAS